MRRAILTLALGCVLGAIPAQSDEYYVRKITHFHKEPLGLGSGNVAVEFENSPNGQHVGTIVLSKPYPFSTLFGQQAPLYDGDKQGSFFIKFLDDMESALVLGQRVDLTITPNLVDSDLCGTTDQCMQWSVFVNSYRISP